MVPFRRAGDFDSQPPQHSPPHRPSLATFDLNYSIESVILKMVHLVRPHSMSSSHNGEEKLTRRFRRAMGKGIKRLGRQHSEDDVSSETYNGGSIPPVVGLRIARRRERQRGVDEDNLQFLPAMVAPPCPAQANVSSQVLIRVEVEVNSATMQV